MSDEKYIRKYETPEGFNDLWMCGDGEALAGLWFDGSRDGTRQWAETRDTAIFCDTCRWHRVIGADASRTGYDGGLGNKISLPAHEGAAVFDIRLSAPKARKTDVDSTLLRRCLRTVNRVAARHGLGRAQPGNGTVICLGDFMYAGFTPWFLT